MSGIVEQPPRKERELPDSYTCEICGRVFKEASHFTKHKRGALCRKTAQRLAKNKRKKDQGGIFTGDKRYKTNIVHKPYQCNVCGAKFCDKVNVELHLERQHQTKQALWVEVAKNGGFACAECDGWFQDKGDLAEHQRQHMLAYSHQPNRIQQQPIGQRMNMPDRPLGQTHNNNNNNTTTNTFFHEPLQPIQPYHQPHPPPLPPQQVIHNNIPSHISTHNQHIIPQQQQPLPPPVNPGSENSNKDNRVGKVSKYPTMCKWNVCGDCGHKFMDQMNLELHLQRKHPDSFIIETVNLGGGTMLYRTNNSTGDVQHYLTENNTSDVRDKQGNHTFDCVLCGYKATSKNYIMYHLQNIHSTSNTNFIHVLENLDTKKTSKLGKGTGRKASKDPILMEKRHPCDICGEVFLSKAELIRHRIKDKQFVCGVCCHASCSQEQVQQHMATHHPDGRNQVMRAGAAMVCWVCGGGAASLAALDDHLATHGTVTAECEACGKCGRGLCSLTPHMTIQHHNATARVKLTVTRPGNQGIVHTVELTADGTLNAGVSQVPQPSPCTSSGVSTSCSSMMASSTTSEEQPKGNTNTRPAIAAYACSQCGACLTQASDIEAHICGHQASLAPITSTISSTSSKSSKSSPSSSASSQLTTATTTTSTTTLPTVSTVAVRGPGSLEFRCEECGYWREESEPVMRHIQAVHMSGNMVHTVRCATGGVQVYHIHVVTPISILAHKLLG
ncbi:uncharacterized protein LOC143032887 isoform X2 [Oratosquilla oratoria]|uniref:uncharacterized protein LOC143032887 isoform X2 n=1 Tax=Oratosquilla oratoria TaxID=337810 RepID=UPI003F76624D